MFAQLKGLFSGDIGIDLGLVAVVRPGSGDCASRAVGGGDSGWHQQRAGRRRGGQADAWQDPGQHYRHSADEGWSDRGFPGVAGRLQHFIQQVHHRKLIAPRVVVAVPSGITEVEKRAVKDSVTHAGAREVYLIEQPMASASAFTACPCMNPRAI